MSTSLTITGNGLCFLNERNRLIGFRTLKTLIVLSSSAGCARQTNVVHALCIKVSEVQTLNFRRCNRGGYDHQRSPCDSPCRFFGFSTKRFRFKESQGSTLYIVHNIRVETAWTQKTNGLLMELAKPFRGWCMCGDSLERENALESTGRLLKERF